jgi:hypothetical protein
MVRPPPQKSWNCTPRVVKIYETAARVIIYIYYTFLIGDPPKKTPQIVIFRKESYVFFGGWEMQRTRIRGWTSRKGEPTDMRGMNQYQRTFQQ